jgi:phosphatidylglycerophosphate synthase
MFPLTEREMKDSWLDRTLHRRLSRPLSTAAVRAGLGPNAVTLASLVVGVGAAWCLTWRGAPGLALVLYLIAVVLDHADGEVARRTGTASRLGHWLDVATDTTVHAVLAVAMGVVASPRSMDGVVIGLVSAGGVVASTALSAWPVDVAADGRVTPSGRFLDALANRHGFYGMLLAFTAMQVVAPDQLMLPMIVLAVGSNAYWVARMTVSLGHHVRWWLVTTRSVVDPPAVPRVRSSSFAGSKLSR